MTGSERSRSAACRSSRLLDTVDWAGGVPFSGSCALAGGRAAGAVRAGPEYLDGVGDVGESVFACGGLGPPLDGGPGYLDCLPAGPADEVVMVAAAAAGPVELLAVGVEHIRGAVIGHCRERPVHGGQADAVPGRAELGVQVLGADEGACGRERLPYRVVAGGHPVLNPSWSGDGHDPIVPSGSRCASGSATALACQQSTSSGRWLRICERAVTKSAY